MQPFTSHDLMRTFELASLRFEASRHLSGDDWKRFREIKARYEVERRETESAYRREYITRVEVTRTRLLEEAGRKTRDLQPRFGGRDKFDAGALERQAHRHVRSEHFNELAQVETRECEELRALVRKAERARDQAVPQTPVKEKPTEAVLNMRSFSIMPARSRSR